MDQYATFQQLATRIAESRSMTPDSGARLKVGRVSLDDSSFQCIQHMMHMGGSQV